jgi:S1-C subfamily serine protease
MKVTVFGVVAACAVVVIAAGSWLLVDSRSQPAAAGASVSAQTNSILFDTSRIVALLQALLSVQNHIQPSSPLATTTIPFSPAATTATTTARTATTTKPTTRTVTAAPTPPTPSQSPTESKLGLILPSLRSSIVNIICIPTSQSILKGISGTGVLIDPRGVILTAAHVAQYELIAQAHPELMACMIRTGRPAANAYTAVPLYVSSKWVKNNAGALSEAMPTGTGENDYALLAITGSATSAHVPIPLPYMHLAAADPTEGDPVVIGSYGAEFLTSARIRSGIFPTLVYGSVKDRFTFVSQTIDLISLGGGAAAQEGSSGGGVANITGQLIGLITTSSTGSNIQTRDLRAITTPYLERAFKAEEGDSIETYLGRDTPKALAQSYTSQANQLASVLIKANGL